MVMVENLELERNRAALKHLAEEFAYPLVPVENPTPIQKRYPPRAYPPDIDKSITDFAYRNISPRGSPPDPDQVAAYIETLGAEALPAVASAFLQDERWIHSTNLELMKKELALAALRTRQAHEFTIQTIAEGLSHADSKPISGNLPRINAFIMNVKAVGRPPSPVPLQ